MSSLGGAEFEAPDAMAREPFPGALGAVTLLHLVIMSGGTGLLGHVLGHSSALPGSKPPSRHS